MTTIEEFKEQLTHILILNKIPNEDIKSIFDSIIVYHEKYIYHNIQIRIDDLKRDLNKHEEERCRHYELWARKKSKNQRKKYERHLHLCMYIEEKLNMYKKDLKELKKQ